MSAPVRLTAAPAAPAPVFAGKTPAGRFEIFDRIAAIGPDLWSARFPPHWKDYRYYRTLEETFAADFTQRYLVLRDETGEVRAIQPFFFVEQDLTASLGPRARAALRPLQRWLRLRLLMVGCIVGEAQTGLRNPADAAAVYGTIDHALEIYARREGVSILLFKDVPATQRRAFAASGTGYTALPSLPAVTLDLTGVTSWDDYFQNRLGKSTRKSLRRKFKDLDAFEPIRLEVRESIDEREAAALHALYEQVARRGDVHFEVFSKEYFLRLGERMPDQARYFIWRQGGKVVAFSFCTVFDGAIYDNDLGLDETLAAPLHLYHVTFRDILRYALAHGLRRYHSSPFNYEPKLRLRMDLTPLDLYARSLRAWANPLLRRFAPLADPTRQEPLLAQFPNGAEIRNRKERA